jgi:hypothetical protein
MPRIYSILAIYLDDLVGLGVHEFVGGADGTIYRMSVSRTGTVIDSTCLTPLPQVQSL